MPGDDIRGYISLGRGITIHRADCKNVKALKKSPERFVEVGWVGENEASYRVELQIDNFATAEEGQAWMHSAAFDQNPIGVEYDPDDLVRRFRAGVPVAELVIRD